MERCCNTSTSSHLPQYFHTPSEPSSPSALEHIATHELPQAGPTQTLGRTIEFAPHLQLLRAHISNRCLVGTKLHTATNPVRSSAFSPEQGN